MFNLFGENLKIFYFKKLKYTMFQTYCSNILLPPLPLPARAFTFKHTSKVAANVNNHRSHMDARSICHTAGLASRCQNFHTGGFLSLHGWIYEKFNLHQIYRFGYGIASSILVSPRGTVIGIISKKIEQPSKPKLNYSGVQVGDQT
jgi:hypothetical protein